MDSLQPRHLLIVERWTLILAAIAIAAATVLAPRATTFALTVGAAMMCLNAYAIRRLAQRLWKRAEENRPGALVLLFNVKMIALIGMVVVAIHVFKLDAIGFLLGVSVFPVAIVVAALRLNLGDDAAQPTPLSGDQ